MTPRRSRFETPGLMTPPKRARVPGERLPAGAGATTPTPRRHETMTTNDTTPREGHESTDFERGTFPLSDADDDEVAEAIEAMADETAAAVEDVTAALQGDQTLTDAHLERVSQATHAVQALTESLILRVPPEGQADPSAVQPDARRRE